MGSYDDLIARLEAATGPDRELDLAIWRLVDPEAAAVEAEGKIPLPWLKLYTSSLDMVMTLVPMGWRLAGMSEDAADDRWYVAITEREGRFGRPGFRAFANSAPLALCIAALKARAATGAA